MILSTYIAASPVKLDIMFIANSSDQECLSSTCFFQTLYSTKYFLNNCGFVVSPSKVGALGQNGSMYFGLHGLSPRFRLVREIAEDDV